MRRGFDDLALIVHFKIASHPYYGRAFFRAASENRTLVSAARTVRRNAPNPLGPLHLPDDILNKWIQTGVVTHRDIKKHRSYRNTNIQWALE